MRLHSFMPRYADKAERRSDEPLRRESALERKLRLIEARLSEPEQQKLRIEEQRRETEWRLRKLQKTPMGMLVRFLSQSIYSVHGG
jgi:hypothetical protein